MLDSLRSYESWSQRRCAIAMLSAIAVMVLLFSSISQAGPMQCGQTAQPACLNSLSLPAGKCVADGWSVDDPTSAVPLKLAGAGDNGFGVSHANRFVGVDMFITHVAIQAVRPTPGDSLAILRIWFNDNTGFGDLRPGTIVDTALVGLPNGISSTDYIVVSLDTTISTGGVTFWVELLFPSANGNCMGTREKYVPGQMGESFVVSHEAAPNAETWVDYEQVSPDTAGAYGQRAPVLRPLQLTDCARTCYVFVGGLDYQTSEDGDSVELECGITEPPLDTVLVDILSTDPGEGIPSVSSLTFTPSNWSIVQHFWVVGQDDAVTDGDIFYQVQVFAMSTDTCYDGESHQFGCENLDNDYVFLETVPVDQPNNPDWGAGYGGVDHRYEIGKYEVTNQQYADFLNAVAGNDLVQSWVPDMATHLMGGIIRSGSAPNYSYGTKPNMANKPVNFVSLHNCMRFCNWLHNGRPNGTQTASTTEDGAYDMSLIGTGVIPRQADALWAIPTLDELYKAAFYDPVNPGADAGGSPDYWYMPTMSDVDPQTKATANSMGDISNPGANVINWDDGAVWNGVVGNLTTVGSAGSGSASFYGTYDQGGNVNEWSEDQFFQSGFTYAYMAGANCHFPFAPHIVDFVNSPAEVRSESQYVGCRVMKTVTASVCGDADGNSIVNISDAVYLIAYIFGGGPAPVPLLVADSDCNGIVNISDAVYLIAYIFGGGPAPCDPDGNGISDC